MGGKKVKTPSADESERKAKEEAEKERVKMIERQRRGISGTIKTSHRGILEVEEKPQLRRKNLLGE